MQIVFQVIAAIVGLGVVALILYAALYIADELEKTKIWEMGRLIKAIVGGLVWAAIGILVAAGLFAIAIVVRAIFFRPVINFFVFQFWAFRVGIGIVILYVLWGLHHGNQNRLRPSFNFRRQPRKAQ